MTDAAAGQDHPEEPAEQPSDGINARIRERLRKPLEPRSANPGPDRPDPLIERLTRRRKADEG